MEKYQYGLRTDEGRKDGWVDVERKAWEGVWVVECVGRSCNGQVRGVTNAMAIRLLKRSV